MSAQIIPFPGATAPAPVPAPKPPRPTPPLPIVRPIRPGKRIPRVNRSEDERVIMLAKLAAMWGEEADFLATTEPGSEAHHRAASRAQASAKLPCRNLRIVATCEDALLGVWRLWRQVRIADLEYRLCDEQRWEAATAGDELARLDWSDRQEAADRKRWAIYERMVRVPADSLDDVNRYKLCRDFTHGLGSLDWMRTHKPEIAAVIDDEIARLNAAKEARRAARSAKKEASA